MFRTFTVILLFLSISCQVNAQERPFRVGIKVGVPEVAALSLEYLTPLMEQKLAAAVDGSYFAPTSGMEYMYATIGANLYFSKPGKGFYGHLGYGLTSMTVNFAQLTEGSFWALFYNKDVNVTEHKVNLKLGYRSGRSVYFRGELGFGLMVSEQISDPNATSSGSFPLLLNLGMGYSF
ncbi:hypothetical protein [Marinoscillum sp. MHG1-6]|uniref:hypothetical protein n=1 Tax=Marinoscillum sp. MHG1-6 TaxID=2959627 RepID=UPI0021572A76|nr:hypothetical protein [Marinoscillum sp. MHG1-6]